MSEIKAQAPVKNKKRWPAQNKALRPIVHPKGEEKQVTNG